MAATSPASMLNQVAAVATDVLYVGVGFAVLAFQRAQVRRRELEKQVSPQVAGLVRTLEERTGTAMRDVVGLVNRPRPAE
jgi:hypothetical protein